VFLFKNLGVNSYWITFRPIIVIIDNPR